MIHLMELENPDPVDGRPVYGGRDRHVCLVVKDLEQIARRLEKKGENLRAEFGFCFCSLWSCSP